MSVITEKLKDLRERMDVSQLELAELVDMKPITYNACENVRRSFRPADIQNILEQAEEYLDEDELEQLKLALCDNIKQINVSHLDGAQKYALILAVYLFDEKPDVDIFEVLQEVMDRQSDFEWFVGE